MRVPGKIVHVLYVIYAFTAFVLLMLPVFLWSILVLPLGKIRAGNLIYKACMAWADIWFALIFIRHRNVYMEGEQKGQPFIYISNHISYLDSAVIPKIFRHPVRPLGKVEMARIPIFGFIYKNVIVTVDRSSSANRSRSVQILKSVLKKGISVLVFPEGTFNTTQEPLKEFYEGAFRIAIETQTPIRPVLLLNTYDRMHYSSLFSLNPGRSVALFLPPIPVEGLTVQDAGDLKKTAFQVMQKALVDNKVSWITMNPANVLNS